MKAIKGKAFVHIAASSPNSTTYDGSWSPLASLYKCFALELQQLPTRGKVPNTSLSHLQRVEQAGPGVHLLREQHRMHPQVSKVVSHFQYEGALRDSPSLVARNAAVPPLLGGQPRAVWYVLD